MSVRSIGWCRPLFFSVVTALALLGASRAGAQVNEDAGLWFGASASGPIFAADEETPWRWGLMGQGRLREDSDGFNQTIAGTSVGYAGPRHVVLSAGYNWLRTWTPGPVATFDEHRIVQRAAWSRERSTIGFVGAMQLEERFLTNVGGVAARWRVLMGMRVPIPGSTVKLNVRDEVFVNLNSLSRGVRSGFDQNRFFAGFGLGLNKSQSHRVELGYLNQYIEPAGATHVMLHALEMNVKLAF